MVLHEDLQVPCQVQKVQEVPHWLDFISVRDTERVAYAEDPDAYCNKAHILMYLNSRHWNENKEAQTLVLSNNTSFRNYQNTASGVRQKTQHNKTRYNRMTFFADCLDAGRVCCKVLETQADSVNFFDNMSHGGYGIGWIYILEEYVYLTGCCSRGRPLGLPTETVTLTILFRANTDPLQLLSASAARSPSPC